jgi:hypothetical protein
VDWGVARDGSHLEKDGKRLKGNLAARDAFFGIFVV